MRATAPVLLVSALRSGSTLLRLMLSHHPQIAFAGEFEWLLDAISPDGRFMKRSNLIKALEANRGFVGRRLTIPPDGNLPVIAESFLDQIQASKPGTQVVGLTLHRDFDRALWLWPDARYIHLVRDGRDVAMSTLPTGWAGNLWHAIRNWVDVEWLWERMSHKLPRERQITVKYEMLVRDPALELRRITDFLGLDYDPAMLRFNEDGSYNPPKGDSTGQWRNKAEPADLSAAEHRAARWLLQNGYFLSGTVRPPSILRRLALHIQHRLAVAAHRRSLFGKGLWFKGLFISRIGTRKARARLVRRQNELLDRAGS